MKEKAAEISRCVFRGAAHHFCSHVSTVAHDKGSLSHTGEMQLLPGQLDNCTKCQRRREEVLVDMQQSLP